MNLKEIGRKDGRGSFPSEKGREKTDAGWRNHPREGVGFGLEPDPFKTAIDRYGIWPVTVWDCDYTDKMMQCLKREIGDGCQLQAGSGTLGYQSKTYGGRQKESGCGKDFTRTNKAKNTRVREFSSGNDFAGMRPNRQITESIFNPAVVIWILNLFCPENAVVYDPFAGGGTRAIITAKSGREYVGVELRQEEIDAIHDRCKYNKVSPKIICADSRNVPAIKFESADFLITCPPYYDLEKYDGGPNDMSMASTYNDFLDMIEGSVKESYRILRPGSLSCWIVGLHRDKNGGLLPLNHDIAWLHRKMGFKLKEEIVLHLKNTGSTQRVGNFERGNKFLIRTHEYCLVFEKEQNKFSGRSVMGHYTALQEDEDVVDAFIRIINGG